MFSHITLGSNQLEAAAAFYDAVLNPIGLRKSPLFENTEVVGWCWASQSSAVPCFYVVEPFDNEPASVGNGVMVAFSAPTKSSVDEAFQAGLAAGGQSEGDPGLRAHYDPVYYGAYLRDVDGNKIHLVCRGDKS